MKFFLLNVFFFLLNNYKKFKKPPFEDLKYYSKHSNNSYQLKS